MTTTEYRQFIGGDWTGASGGATFEDLDPYSGEVVATVAAGTREDARRAIEAAVARANDTGYGLTAGILTGDTDRGLALAERLQAGIVHVNDQPVHDEPQMPFGGVKDSGWGRFGGQAAIDEFTELRWVTVQSGTRPFPF
jgi:acyl-CoA reductase-like NAD-dependent aldehyde dehydrogenase